jgi:tRNA A-37 threonylcarbamoyl transferase component Bud32
LIDPKNLLLDQLFKLEDGTDFVVKKIIRIVPNKRIVYLGVWQNQAVYAKFFFGASKQRYAKRDADGIRILQKNNIDTPAFLQWTQAINENAEVLLIKAHPQATNIEVVMQKSTGKERLGLALKVVETVAKHHLVNLIQTDLYFKNFLIEDQTVLSIDGDGIRQFSHLSDQKAIENLSVLLSKLDVIEIEDWLPVLLNCYHQVNPKPALAICQIKRQSKTHRINVATQYATKKVFRQCSDVNVRQTTQSFMAIASNFSSLLEFEALDNIEADMAGALLLKDGNTCSVALVTLKQTPVVIKRYNIKNTMHLISRMWRPSRASASWSNAHRLTLLDIPTPAPVAFLETRFFGLRGKAYFLSEYVESLDIAEYFAKATDQVARAILIRNTVELFYRLFLLNISHGDMKATNIKVIDNTPMLIDLDSMQQHTWHYFAQKAHVRDLKRFMQNWKQDTSLYNAFLKNFKVIYADHAVLHKAHLI